MLWVQWEAWFPGCGSSLLSKRMYEKLCKNLSVFFLPDCNRERSSAHTSKAFSAFLPSSFLFYCALAHYTGISILLVDQIGAFGPFSIPLCGIFLDGFLWPLTRLLPFKKKSSCSTHILRSSFYDSDLVFLPGYLLLLLLSSPFFGGDLVF